MGKFIDMTGWIMKEHDVPNSMLTVIERYGVDKSGRVRWKCICECGNTTISDSNSLRCGIKVSCGCEKINSDNSDIRLHKIWSGIKQRCYNQNDTKYYCYGGKGISVCNEWKDNYKSFKEWALSNGYASNLTIDRINVNGNYEPSNCRWITNLEQQNNKTTNRMLTYKGETHTMSEWCRILNLNYRVVKTRLNVLKWSVEQALSTPTRTGN